METTQIEAASTSAPGAKADIIKRLIAAVIDAVLAVIIGFIPLIGGFAAAAYMLLRDGFEVELMNRRSIGKTVMKLRVVSLDGAPMDLARSAKRSWMFALGGVTQALLFIPVIGWLLLPLVAIAALVLVVVEVVLVLISDDGRRWGDKLAGTQVIESAE